MRNFGRILAIAIVLGIAAVALYMCTVQRPVPVPEPEAEPAPLMEPVPEATPMAEPEPEMLAEPQAAAMPEPVLLEPASCTFPGDGFTPTPHGFTRMAGQEIYFDDATYQSGYNGAALPMRDGVDLSVAPSACVVVTYDISADGRPVNVQVYDTAIAGDDASGSGWYEREAVSRVSGRVFAPAERNGKPIRVDNNVMTVRFGAA